MLDMRKIRANPDEVKRKIAGRGKNMDGLIDEVIALDGKRRSLSIKIDSMRAELNSVSKEIAARKRSGEELGDVIQQLKMLSAEIKKKDAEKEQVEQTLWRLLRQLPNLPDASVPNGIGSNGNQEVRRIGTPRSFLYEPKPYWEIGAELGVLDLEKIGESTGPGVRFYKGLGARLERSLVNFFLDTHAEAGYTEISPFYLVGKESLKGAGQFPKIKQELSQVAGASSDFIPTEEVSIINLYQQRILDGNDLPLSYCIHSTCPRGEVGEREREARSLTGQCRYNQVELVKLVRPEESYQELERLTGQTERLLQLLDLPYRIVTLYAGELGFSSAKTYRIEVWMPCGQRYEEIATCSNWEDFQARRGQIRFKDAPKEKAKYPHILNGSGPAIGRTVAAILENYQNEDGSVTVPDILVPYLRTDRIRRR